MVIGVDFRVDVAEVLDEVVFPEAWLHVLHAVAGT